jgi:hypothetical protein
VGRVIPFGPLRREIHVVELILAKKAMSDLPSGFTADNSERLSRNICYCQFDFASKGG